MNPLFTAAIGVAARKRRKDREKARAAQSAAAQPKRVSEAPAHLRPAPADRTKKEK
jgi:hypothetical protein